MKWSVFPVWSNMVNIMAGNWVSQHFGTWIPIAILPEHWESSATSGNLSGLFKFGSQTRLNLDFVHGQWQQLWATANVNLLCVFRGRNFFPSVDDWGAFCTKWRDPCGWRAGFVHGNYSSSHRGMYLGTFWRFFFAIFQVHFSRSGTILI